MQITSQAANPFALLIDPQAIFRAVEASAHLEALARRVCRPLDRNQRTDDSAGDGDAGHEDTVMDTQMGDCLA